MQRTPVRTSARVVFVVLLMLTAPAAIMQGNNLLLWLSGAMICLAVLSVVLSWIMIRGMHVQRLDPSHGEVGEPLVVQYAVTRRSRWLPSFNLFIDERPDGAARWVNLMSPARAWIMQIGVGETLHTEAVFLPRRRGEARFDRMTISTTFPFGMVRRRRSFRQPQHTLIYPRVYALTPFVLRSLTPVGPHGIKMTQRRGDGDDYFGTREHRPGDGARAIAWRASARRDALVAIDRSHPSPPRVRVCLDLTTPTDDLQVAQEEPISAADLEERAISLCASLVRTAADEGYEVGLTVYGLDIPDVPIRRSRWHVQKIMTLLAAIDLAAERTPMAGTPVAGDERAGLIVVRPDRVEPLPIRFDAWYLTGRQLGELSAEPLDDAGVVGPAGSRSAAAVPDRGAMPADRTGSVGDAA